MLHALLLLLSTALPRTVTTSTAQIATTGKGHIRHPIFQQQLPLCAFVSSIAMPATKPTKKRSLLISTPGVVSGTINNTRARDTPESGIGNKRTRKGSAAGAAKANEATLPAEAVNHEDEVVPLSPSRMGDRLVDISRRLHDRLKDKKWKGTGKQTVTCSYNVLEYASDPHEAYTRKYGGRTTGRALVVGMNPGPWGMVQTGVPFGEVGFVRDWLGVQGEVGRPSKEHPKRPVDGFACKRSEVSGTRLWGFFERRFGTADAWGDNMFAYNYCPLTFMSSSGGNITPDKLPPAERRVIEDACGGALTEMIVAMRPCVLVGVGNFAGTKCLEALEKSGLNDVDRNVEVVVVNHPSPASPTGIKWQKATHLNELVLASSKGKEIDRFLR